MRRPESAFKKYLMRLMGTTWDAQSHEDAYSEGIPDISFAMFGLNGWIELKIAHFPVLKDTPINLDHLTPNQVNWLIKRGNKGKGCFLLVKVDETFYLFSHALARPLRAGLTKEQYDINCVAKWDGTMIKEEFIDAVTSSMV